MDEMQSFYHDKEHQIWLWWAIDHDTGLAVAYWFGTREHGNLDKPTWATPTTQRNRNTINQTIEQA